MYKIHTIKSKFSLEQFYNFALVFIIFGVILTAYLALNKQIDYEQVQNVHQIALQSTYKKSQNMAYDLLMQEQIKVGEYFRLMMSYQLEESKSKHLPPVAVERY